MGDRNMGGKTDMERVGLFQEMGHVSIGDRYRAAGSVHFNQAATKGKQMLPGGTKSRSSLQAGYFDSKFNRIMEAEAYSDPIKMRRQHRLKQSTRNIGKAFLPSSGEKLPSGLGSHYGTLGGPTGAFSPAIKTGKGYKSPGKNFMTNPGKKGTGYGFSGVTIGKYNLNMPEPFDAHKAIATVGRRLDAGKSCYVGITISGHYDYKSDPFDRSRELTKKELELHKSNLKGGAFKLNMHPVDYFDTNPYHSDRPNASGKRADSSKRIDFKPFKPSSPPKQAGGMKAGTFDPYPSHSADPYKVKISRAVNVVNKMGKIFTPSPGPKTTPTVSIINQNVLRSINIQNYRSVSSITV